MIARAGDVVVLESPPNFTKEAAADIGAQCEKFHELTGVRLLFVPAGTKSPESEGMKALVDEVAKLRIAVQGIATRSMITGPR